MTSTYDSEADEMLQRTRRIETRLMTLGTALGVNLREDEWVKVFAADEFCNKPYVVIDSMDVSVSAVIRAARKAGLHGKKVVVYFKGERVAEGLQA